MITRGWSTPSTRSSNGSSRRAAVQPEHPRHRAARDQAHPPRLRSARDLADIFESSASRPQQFEYKFERGRYRPHRRRRRPPPRHRLQVGQGAAARQPRREDRPRRTVAARASTRMRSPRRSTSIRRTSWAPSSRSPTARRSRGVRVQPRRETRRAAGDARHLRASDRKRTLPGVPEREGLQLLQVLPGEPLLPDEARRRGKVRGVAAPRPAHAAAAWSRR